MIQIRRTTYHGRPGFLVCGRAHRGRPCDNPDHIVPCAFHGAWANRVAIFTRTRAVAERIRDKIKADPTRPDINSQDFEGDHPQPA